MTVVSGLERHVLGDAVQAAANPEEDTRPFAATFRNMGARAVAVVPTSVMEGNPARTVLASGESVELTVSAGAHVDWFDAETADLLFRSVVERNGQKSHVYRDAEYTHLCLDKTPASAPVATETYFDPAEGRALRVEILSRDPLIAQIPDWTVGGECATLEGMAYKTGLAGAQVFGTRTIIAERRAGAANLYWDARNESALTNRLITRAFDLARDQRGYDIHPGPFQEPLNFIEYDFGGEYRPHCDGVCSRTPYARGGQPPSPPDTARPSES